MLGTDAAGTEHSSIGRQYQLATSLVNYWSETGNYYYYFLRVFGYINDKI